MDLGANVYSEDFEQHFLARAAEFYQARPFPHDMKLLMPAAWAAAIDCRYRRSRSLAAVHCSGATSQQEALAVGPLMLLYEADGCCQHPSVAAQIEAQEFLGSCSCPQYMERAERRLHEEVERVDNYLDPSSEPKITRVVENELIQKQVLPRSAAVPQLLCLA